MNFDSMARCEYHCKCVQPLESELSEARKALHHETVDNAIGISRQADTYQKRIRELEAAGTPYWKERDTMNALVLDNQRLREENQKLQQEWVPGWIHERGKAHYAKVLKWLEDIAAMPCCLPPPGSGRDLAYESECKACQAGLAYAEAKYQEPK